MPALLELIRSIEAAGFDGAGILDSQLLSRDTFATLGLAAIAATSFAPDEVVADICDALGLVGTADDCAARIIDMAKLGARSLYIMPFQSFAPPEAEVRAFRDVVFERLRVAGLRDG